MEPTKIVAGDTVSWTASYPDYPAGDSWVLTYEARGPKAFSISTSASGDDFAVALTAADSDGYVPGKYTLYGLVSKGAERYTVYTGALEVVANPAEIQDGFEARGHAARMVALLEAAIENYAANPYQSITIAGRTSANWSLSELMKWRDVYRQEAKREEAAAKVEQGLAPGGRVFVRFGETS